LLAHQADYPVVIDIRQMLRLVQASIIVGIAVLSFSPLSSAMAVSDCGVLGCGVLGTSLCKQIVNSPGFSSWKGNFQADFYWLDDRGLPIIPINFFSHQFSFSQ
jgi:hypothetical protein